MKKKVTKVKVCIFLLELLTFFVLTHSICFKIIKHALVSVLYDNKRKSIYNVNAKLINFSSNHKFFVIIKILPNHFYVSFI